MASVRTASLPLVLALCLSGCTTGKAGGSDSPTEADATDATGGEASDTANDTGHNGASVHHCLANPATGTVPEDLYTSTDVTATSDYGQFTKSLSVYGITLVAKDDVSDDFLRTVRQAVIEMFPTSVDEPDTQAQILSAMYAHRAVIPVFAGGESGIDEAAIETILDGQNTICDIIMQGSERQVMEVVEHLLHYVSDVGLHVTYPAQWGLTDGSALFGSSEAAQSANAYDASSYTDIPLPERHGIVLQEYAYWIISTYWDLQAPYGPKEPEWTVADPGELQRKVPSAHELIEETVAHVMTAPSTATLDALQGWEG